MMEWRIWVKKWNKNLVGDFEMLYLWGGGRGSRGEELEFDRVDAAEGWGVEERN